MEDTQKVSCPYCNEQVTPSLIELRFETYTDIAYQCPFCHEVGDTVLLPNGVRTQELIDEAYTKFVNGQTYVVYDSFDMTCALPSPKSMYNYRTVKGFNDLETSFIEDVALVQTELSEAIQSWCRMTPKDDPHWYGNEFADAILRILGLCEKYNVGDVPELCRLKLKSLAHRPHMHGKSIGR